MHQRWAWRVHLGAGGPSGPWCMPTATSVDFTFPTRQAEPLEIWQMPDASLPQWIRTPREARTLHAIIHAIMLVLGFGFVCGPSA